MKHARPTPNIVAPSVWPDTMGLEDAADYLRLGRDATRALFDQGALPGVSLNQKHMVFRRTALDAFLASMEVEQQQQKKRDRKTGLAANSAQEGESAGHRSKRKSPPDLARYEEM